jgi:uncharacterized protein YsxB (DUF464 family)
MTEVTVEKKRNLIEIKIVGHAGYNPGNDIVCSACSILTYTLIQNLINAEKEDKALRIISQDISNGYVCLLIEPLRHRVYTIIDVISSGFKLLQDQYPEFVKFCG